MDSIKLSFISILCLLMLLAHVCVIIALVKVKKFGKVRFYRLALYLSISDACIILEFLIHLIITGVLLHQTTSKLYACLILKHLVAGTIFFSLLQTLFICIDRLNATFRTPRTVLKKITNNYGVVAGFIITHAYALGHCFAYFSEKPRNCDANTSVRRSVLWYFDTLIITLVACITICYIVVIFRIVQRQTKRVGVNLSGLQLEQMKKDISTTRRHVITLSCIVIVALSSITPRTIYGLYLQNGASPGERDEETISWTNYLLLLNPLFDPFIYVVRIKCVREKLRSKCTNAVFPINESTL